MFLELVVLLKLVILKSAACDFIKPEGGENEIITTAVDTPDIEEKHDNGNINNIATYKGELQILPAPDKEHKNVFLRLQ